MNPHENNHRTREAERERNENRALIKKINRVSVGRRKVGIDGVKIALIMVAMMAVIAVILIVIGNLDLSGIGGIPRETPYNGEPEPYIHETVMFYDVFDTTPIILHGIDEYMVFYHYNSGLLELPIVGATGWVAADSPLRDTPGMADEPIFNLVPGTAFTIVDYSGEWWYINLPDGTTGWIDSRRCFINLPDVLPSALYRISNAGASLFRSGGYALPEITGQQMYNARAFNYRLARYEYIVPVMMITAYALHTAQQLAWADGHTLVIYEVFRPRSVQLATVEAMQELMQTNPSVNRAISDSTFSLSWFITTGISNQQRGAAVDVTLARVHDTEILQTGGYSFIRVVDYTEIITPSPLHELSPASSIVNTPRGITPSDILGDAMEMTGPAMSNGIARMQYIFASAGFRPLASQWWHFNHDPGVSLATTAGITGEFYTQTIYSVPPSR